MVFANPTAVLIEGHVQRPMQLVLNVPVLTNQGRKACRASSQTGQVEAIVAGDLVTAVRGANRLNRNDRVDAGPLLQFSHAAKVAQYPEASSNRAPVGDVKGIEEGAFISQVEVVLDVVVKVAADGTVGSFVIALEGDEIIALLFKDLPDDGSLASHGVIVTIQPLMAKSSRSSGMAVISLDLLCVPGSSPGQALSWPMTRPPFCEHQADTTCTGDSSVARSNDALTVLPSSETTAP